MADVLEAYDRKLERRVAVKLLRSRTAHERFAREARMVAGLTPNVVPSTTWSRRRLLYGL